MEEHESFSWVRVGDDSPSPHSVVAVAIRDECCVCAVNHEGECIGAVGYYQELFHLKDATHWSYIPTPKSSKDCAGSLNWVDASKETPRFGVFVLMEVENAELPISGWIFHNGEWYSENDSVHLQAQKVIRWIYVPNPYIDGHDWMGFPYEGWEEEQAELRKQLN
jgi:hypothetical protein